MKQIDKLGRIVIPKSLRKKYGLSDGSTVEFLDTGDGIALKLAESHCKICRAKIPKDARFPLCERCIREVMEYGEAEEQ